MRPSGQQAGIALVLFSAVAFAAMSYFVKLATASVPGAEVAFFRFGAGLLVVVFLTVLSVGGRRLGVPAAYLVRPTMRLPGWLAARGILGGIAILLFYLAYSKSSLTNVAILNNSTPVYATILSALVLREKVTGRIAAALIVSLGGVVLLVNGFTGWSRPAAGDLLAIASAVVSAAAIIAIRVLRKTESTWSVFSALCLGGLLVTWAYGHATFIALTGKPLTYTLVAAFLSVVAQLAVTTSYRYLTVAIGTILSMSTVLFTSALGLLLLGERLTGWQLAGAVLLIAGCVYIAVYPGPSASKSHISLGTSLPGNGGRDRSAKAGL